MVDAVVSVALPVRSRIAGITITTRIGLVFGAGAELEVAVAAHTGLSAMAPRAVTANAIHLSLSQRMNFSHAAHTHALPKMALVL